MNTRHTPNPFSARRISALLVIPVLVATVATSAPTYAQSEYAAERNPGDIEIEMTSDAGPVMAVEALDQDGHVASRSAAEPSLRAGEPNGGWMEPTAQTKSWTLSGPWAAVNAETRRYTSERVDFAGFDPTPIIDTTKLEARPKVYIPRDGAGQAAVGLVVVHRRSWTVPEDGVYNVRFVYGYSDDLWLSYGGRPKGGEYALAHSAVWYGVCSTSHCGHANPTQYLQDLRRESIAKGDVEPREIQVNPAIKTAATAVLAAIGVEPQISEAVVQAAAAIIGAQKIYSKDQEKLEVHRTWSEIETRVPLPLALRKGEEVHLYAVTFVGVEARGRSDSRAGADFRVAGQPLSVVFSKPVDPVPPVPPPPSEPQPYPRPACPLGSYTLTFQRDPLLSPSFDPPQHRVGNFILMPQLRSANKPFDLDLVVQLDSAPPLQEILDFRWDFLFIDPDRSITDNEYWSGRSTSQYDWQPGLGGERIRISDGWSQQMAFGIEQWQFCTQVEQPQTTTQLAIHKTWTVDWNGYPKNVFSMNEGMKVQYTFTLKAPQASLVCLGFDLLANSGWMPRAGACFVLTSGSYLVTLWTTPERFGAALGLNTYRVRATCGAAFAWAVGTFYVR